MELISKLWIQFPPPTTLLKENIADGNGLYSKLDLSPPVDSSRIIRQITHCHHRLLRVSILISKIFQSHKAIKYFTSDDKLPEA